MAELDKTFVLESYKGKPLPDTVDRTARRHGAKAQKRGISSEYICICAGIQRKGEAYAATINRAKPDAAELASLFSEHIAQGTLVLCDGLKSYRRRNQKVKEIAGQELAHSFYDVANYYTESDFAALDEEYADRNGNKVKGPALGQKGCPRNSG